MMKYSKCSGCKNKYDKTHFIDNIGKQFHTCNNCRSRIKHVKEYIKEIDYAITNYENCFINDTIFFDKIYDSIKLYHHIIMDYIINID